MKHHTLNSTTNLRHWKTSWKLDFGALCIHHGSHLELLGGECKNLLLHSIDLKSQGIFNSIFKDSKSSLLNQTNLFEILVLLMFLWSWVQHFKLTLGKLWTFNIGVEFEVHQNWQLDIYCTAYTDLGILGTWSIHKVPTRITFR